MRNDFLSSSGVRLSNLSHETAKKQSTITEMFANQKGSPRKHKLPQDAKDEDFIPPKRPRLDETPSPGPENKDSKSSTSPVGDSVVNDVAEADIHSESADSESTEIYWPPKDGAGADHDDNAVGRPDSRSLSPDDHFAKPQSMSMSVGASDGTKARDTPTTRALIKAQGSEPISCPVCGREFKSRNMTHITSHIDRCLEAANQMTSAEKGTSEQQNHEVDGEELFGDECEELFSSRESQILLSQVEKEQESDAGEKSEAEETAENKQIHDVIDDVIEVGVDANESKDILADVTADDKREEGEIKEDEGDTVQDKENQNEEENVKAPTEAEDEESEEVAEKVSKNTTNETSEELISEVTETSEDAEETNREADSTQNAADTSTPEQAVNGDSHVNENGHYSNGLSEATTADNLCPICNVVQLSDLRLFHLHVDRCLKKQEETNDNDDTESETPSQSESSEYLTDSQSNVKDDALSYLKNISPRRPLRTGSSRTSTKSSTSS